MYVYSIYNNLSNKYYVGRTIYNNLDKYISYNKVYPAKVGKFNGMPILRSIAKHGWDNFTVDVLAETNDYNHLCDLEQLWIVILNAQDRIVGYNVCPGGRDSRKGLVVSDETRAKLSASHIGLPRSAEHKHKISKNMKQLHRDGLAKYIPVIEATANLTPEQKEARDAKRKATWIMKDPEERALHAQRTSMASKASWAKRKAAHNS